MDNLIGLIVTPPKVLEWYKGQYISRTSDGYVFGFDGQKPLVLTCDDVCNAIKSQTGSTLDNVRRYLPVMQIAAIAYAVYRKHFC